MTQPSARRSPRIDALSTLLARLRSRPARAGRGKPQPRFRPQLELLETRLVPALVGSPPVDNTSPSSVHPATLQAPAASPQSMPTPDDLGLLLLDPTGQSSLRVAGSGKVTASGSGAVVVDSSNPSAAFLSGHATVTAADIDVTGGAKTTGQGSFSRAVDQETAIPDPLGLALPPPPSTTFSAVQYSGSTPLTLEPGAYVGGISISGSGPVTLAPGVYYLEGGGFSVSGQGHVNGTGVTIINAPASATDTIRVSQQGSLNLSAPSAGPFQGVALLQDPSSANPIQLTGQGSATLTGVVYAPKALVSITGNANVTINAGPGTAGTQPPILGSLIAYDLNVDGKGALTINPDPPTPANAGFELPNLGTGFFAFRDGAGRGGNPGTLTAADQGGAGWAFTADSGIAANGSAFNVAGADGNQAGFLHLQSTITQSVGGFGAQSYVIHFLAEGRGTQAATAGSNDIQVLIDNTPVTFSGVTTITPNAGAAFTAYTSDPFNVTAGAHTVTFKGLDTLGGDRASFIDDVSFSPPPPPPPPPTAPAPANVGFEQPNLGTGFSAFRDGAGRGGNPGTLTAADQGGAGWTFTADSGIAANGSAFNDAGADGNQAGFLHYQSSISQSIGGFSGQSYVVTFLAEGRGTQAGTTGSNDIQVLIDNMPLTFSGAATITPGAGTFTTYTSDPFSVSAGTHALTFNGLDTLGGDRTSFIDDVSIGAPPPPPPPPPGPSAANAGFELPNLGTGFSAFRDGAGRGGNPGTLTAADQGGAGWTFTDNSGIAANSSAFNVSGADGNQAGFLHLQSSISQSIDGFAGQSYVVSFLAEGRGTQAGTDGSNNIQVMIDNTQLTFTGATAITPDSGAFTLYTSDPFTVTAGTHNLTFNGLDSLGGDRASFIDDVAFSTSPTPPPPHPGPSPANAGFELPNLGTGSSAFRDGAGRGGNPGTLTAADQGGAGWTFTDNSGIAANGSAFDVSGADGNQAGFVHLQSSISQSISGFAGQSYVVSFLAEGRGTQAGTDGSNNIQVMIDNTELTFNGVTSITPGAGAFTQYTSDPFFVTAGTHTVSFNGLDSLGGDRTSFIDDVTLSTSSAPPPPPPSGPSVPNAGFEQPNLGIGVFAYRDGAGRGGNPGTLTAADQGGAGWTFTADSGIAANSSAFDVSGADGNQAGFVHLQSSISQSIDGFAGQSYIVSFLAEGRGTQSGTAGSNDIQVMIDNTPVTFSGAATITPDSAAFTLYTSDPFAVSAGTHTLTFNGLDSLGGDRTSFVDDVTFSAPPSAPSSSAVLAAPASTSTALTGGPAISPSPLLSGSSTASSAGQPGPSLPPALLLIGRPQAVANSPILAPASASLASTVNQAALDQLFSNGLDDVFVLLGYQPKRASGTWADSIPGLV